MPPFALSPECLAAGTVTPRAERSDRRAAWLFASFLIPLLAAAAFVLGATAFLACLPFAVGGSSWYIRRQGAIHRRRRRLWKEPFPAEAEAFLLREIPHYARLDESGRDLFRQRAKIFLEEVVFHDAGVAVTDDLRLRAAASAVVPSLGFPEWQWRELREIIFRPEGFEDGSYVGDEGVVTEFEESGMVGSSGVLSGVMMLSAEDLVWEFAHLEDGMHVGFHEFAHLMAATGLALAERDRAGWAKLLKNERRLIADGESLLDDYALLNEDEVFAVASELFFTIPHRFREWHRELYAVLSRAYRQDPCQWLEDCAPPPEMPHRRKRRRGGRR